MVKIVLQFNFPNNKISSHRTWIKMRGKMNIISTHSRNFCFNNGMILFLSLTKFILHSQIIWLCYDITCVIFFHARILKRFKINSGNMLTEMLNKQEKCIIYLWTKKHTHNGSRKIRTNIFYHNIHVRAHKIVQNHE